MSEDIKVLHPASVANLRSDVVEAKIAEGKNNKLDAEKMMMQKQKEERLQKKEQRLAAPKATKAAPRQNNQPEYDEDAWAEEQEWKQLCFDKITSYRDKFKSLKKRNNISAKSSLEEMEDEVHYIESQLGTADSGPDNPASMALIASMTGIEYLTENHYNPLNLNLSNLGKTTRDNIDKFEPLLDELLIKHGHKLVVSVEMRLCLMIGTTVMTVHAANNGVNWPSKIAAATAKVDEHANANKYESI